MGSKKKAKKITNADFITLEDLYRSAIEERSRLTSENNHLRKESADFQDNLNRYHKMLESRDSRIEFLLQLCEMLYNKTNKGGQ
jgi:hypothetical protein